MLGVVCGLEAEAEIARRQPGALVALSAARPARARKRAQELVRGGAKGLLSFGLAGALSPDLSPGALVVGTAIESRGRTFLCDAAWSDALERACKADASGFVCGSEVALESTEAKELLFVRTGALIVDMESQAVAEVASEAKIPFTVLRAVADDAMMSLPQAARVPLRLDGTPDMQKILQSLALHPWELAALIRLGAATAKAMKTLRRIGAIHWAEV